MHIYALMSGQLVLYVGRTVNPKQREYRHRSKGNHTSGSRHIPLYTDWNMKLLEECSTELSKLREQYWMDELKPLYNEVNAVNRLSNSERVRAYRATEEFKTKRNEAQRKNRAKKRALKSSAALS